MVSGWRGRGFGKGVQGNQQRAGRVPSLKGREGLWRVLAPLGGPRQEGSVPCAPLCACSCLLSAALCCLSPLLAPSLLPAAGLQGQ